MTEKQLYILLSLIKQNGSVNSLLAQGMSYQKIAELTSKIILDGQASFLENSLSLTDSGEALLTSLREKVSKTDSAKWIVKETRSIIPKIDKNFIFLPNQNELFF